MIDYRNLEALAAVVDERGFERAGNRLHITQSAVTQRIRQLEDLTGQILLIRSQPPSVTEAGKELLEHFRKVQVLEQEFSERTGIIETHQKPRISLAVNADSLNTWFSHVVSEYFSLHSGFLDIRSADQDMTHHLMVAGEVMGCISSISTPFRGCKRDFIGNMSYRFVSTRAFAERYFPEPMDATSFQAAPKLNFNRDDQLLSQWASQFFPSPDSFHNSHLIPSSDQFPILIREGEVCGMLTESQFEASREEYDLIDLSMGKAVSAPLYWHRWSIQSAELEQLSTIIQDVAKETLTKENPQ